MKFDDLLKDTQTKQDSLQLKADQEAADVGPGFEADMDASSATQITAQVARRSLDGRPSPAGAKTWTSSPSS
jgi:hypothetical protein